MSDLDYAVWGLLICGGLLALMVFVAVVWVEIKSFFEKDK